MVSRYEQTCKRKEFETVRSYHPFLGVGVLRITAIITFNSATDITNLEFATGSQVSEERHSE
jgi:hypothetical protein